MEYKLRYGCNPHQKNAKFVIDRDPSPLKILNGNPGYINILDTLSAWQLVKELDDATGKASATSFKHVSPAGAAISGVLTGEFRKSQFITVDDLSPVATAYARARGGDRMCSYGDAAAVSRTVDLSLARLMKLEAIDSVIAPGYEPKALELLKTKKKGNLLLIKIKPDYEPDELEKRTFYGFQLLQNRNNRKISHKLFENIVSSNTDISPEEIESLIVATISLKYTQSNSVCIAYDGQVIGMGAGQQSRIHCTRIACAKAFKWFFQQHPKVMNLNFREGLKRVRKTNIVDQYLLWNELSVHEREVMLAGLSNSPEPIEKTERQEWIKRYNGICLSSDALIPFRDNIDAAGRANVRCVAHTGGALRDDEVTEAANDYGMVMIHTGLRLFTH